MRYDYIIIGIIFFIALFFLVKKIATPFFKKGKGCDGGSCGCSSNKKETN